MIKEKDIKDLILDDYEGSPKNSDIALQEFVQRITAIAQQNGIPVDASVEEIKMRKGVRSSVYHSVVLRHPEHLQDYYGVLVTVNTSGVRPMLNAWLVGESKYMGLIEKNEKAREGREKRRHATDNVVGWLYGMVVRAPVSIVSYAMSAVRRIMRDDDKVNTEKSYYAQCISVVKEAVNI